jgi:hypothetical protein
MIKKSIPFILSLLISQQAIAGVCDYRPSKVLGGGATTGAATLALTGVGAKAAGFYTLVHAGSGATMLASTAAGVSGAGTIGIIGGTAGIVGTIGSIIMAPAVMLGGAILGVGVGALEGACYFTVKRVDDYDMVIGIMKNMSERADPKFFHLVNVGKDLHYIKVADKFNKLGEPISHKKYKVKNLYVEDGILRHKDWFVNTKIGKVLVTDGNEPK